MRRASKMPKFPTFTLDGFLSSTHQNKGFEWPTKKIRKKSGATRHRIHLLIICATFIRFMKYFAPTTNIVRLPPNINWTHISSAQNPMSNFYIYFCHCFFPFFSIVLYYCFISRKRNKKKKEKQSRSNRKSINPLFKRFRIAFELVDWKRSQSPGMHHGICNA